MITGSSYGIFRYMAYVEMFIETYDIVDLRATK